MIFAEHDHRPHRSGWTILAVVVSAVSLLGVAGAAQVAGAAPLASTAGTTAVPAAPGTGTVSAGGYHTCGVRTNGTAVCWGNNDNGQGTPPGGTFIQVSAGFSHTCGVRTDGTLACWGDNSYGQGTPPAETFIQVSAGLNHTCGVRTDGTAACWGDNTFGQASPPAGTFSQVSAGRYHTCGARTDGTAACWGFNAYGQATPPAGTFSQVSAGIIHTCGVRTDATAACWGDNTSGQATPPAGTFSQISGGYIHTCGVKTDGTVACWGDNSYGQATPLSLVVPSADLADMTVTKTGPTSVVAGANATYSISVTDNGPTAALNPNLVDALADGTTFLSETHPAGWTCSDPAVGTNGTLSCTALTLASGATAAFTLTVVLNSSVASGSTIANTATVSSDTPDPDGSNNSSATSATSTTMADMAVTKTGPATVVPGANATYAISVTNNGPSDALNPALVDALAAGTTFVSETHPVGWTCADPAVGTNGTLSCTASTLASGAGAAFTLTAHLNASTASGTAIANTATVSSDTPDPDGSNNSSVMSATSTAMADMAVTKSGPTTVVPGTNATYAISVTNNGPSDAVNPKLVDPLAAGTTFVSETHPAGWTCSDPPVATNGTLSCTASTLASGASAAFTLTVHVNSSVASGSTIANTATVSSDTPDPDGSNNSSVTSATSTAMADMAISKSGPATVVAGTNATYAISVTNNGPSDALNPKLVDALTAGTTFVSETHPVGWTCSDPAVGTNGTLSCTASTLASGASAAFTLTARLNASTASGTTVANTATVSSDTPDPDGSNNSSVTSATSTAMADMAVTKSGPTTVVPGANATYAISVTNNGPSDAVNPTTVDPLAAGTTFVSETHPAGWTCSDPAVGTNGTLSCTASTLASGASAAFTLTVHLNATTASGSAIPNTATVSSDTPDPVGSNNSSAVSTTAICEHIITGSHHTSVTLSGGSWCVNAAHIDGNVKTTSGTTAVIVNSTIGGSVTASGGRSFTMCGSTVGGSLNISGATGFVLIGDPEDDGCAGNSIGTKMRLVSNHAGVEVNQNRVTNLTLTNNAGGGPFADDASPEVETNTVHGSLNCSGNVPAPTNDGAPNAVDGSKTGQCSGL